MGAFLAGIEVLGVVEVLPLGQEVPPGCVLELDPQVEGGGTGHCGQKS